MTSVSIARSSPASLVQALVQSRSDQPGQAPLNLFALVEPDQDNATLKRLAAAGQRTVSLLGVTGRDGQPAGPQLVDLGGADAPTAATLSALAAPHPTQVFTVLCSELGVDELQAHLLSLTDVHLPGGVLMTLAFWDPAILGTLLGQAGDDSLHVPGPVLDAAQTAGFIGPVRGWWYCDRLTRWHAVEVSALADDTGQALPLKLDQAQEDQLVEASVPDQVLYQLELNQSHLFQDDQSHAMRYGFVKAVLGPARQLGLDGMRDLVNFTALCLIYRRRMQTDERILALLDQVQAKTLTLDQALPLMPE
jgi:Domain of unknown function (DUF4123)